MKRWLCAVSLAGLLALLAGCSRPVPEETASAAADLSETPETAAAGDETSGIKVIEGAGPNNDRTVSIRIVDEDHPAQPGRVPEKVRGIYISGMMAGNTEAFMNILDSAAGTEINTVVIDLKDDEGRMTCSLDTPTVNEIGACRPYIDDIEGLISSLKERGLYVIARVVAFRDPYLAEQKPEWSLHLADGSLYRDRSGMAWVDPYRKEVWDYLVEIGTAAKAVGFDEVQFDYIRFCTESTMKAVVFDESVTEGRSKTDAITEFVTYAYECLASQGLYVSADVFGTIIGSEVDAEAVGQIYTEMAKHLDYICPMIYPSHYGSGNFGIENPDTDPYHTVLQALLQSKEELERAAAEMETDADTETGTDTETEAGGKADEESADRGGAGQLALVRPWLQDFTASYLGEGKFIPYGEAEVAAQIQAVKDAGYDEWFLWNAANRYHFGGVGAAQSEETENGAAQSAETTDGGTPKMEETTDGGTPN